MYTCTKTYLGFGSENKIGCKGLNKRTNDITKERYLDVLRSQSRIPYERRWNVHVPTNKNRFLISYTQREKWRMMVVQQRILICRKLLHNRNTLQNKFRLISKCPTFYFAFIYLCFFIVFNAIRRRGFICLIDRQDVSVADKFWKSNPPGMTQGQT